MRGRHNRWFGFGGGGHVETLCVNMPILFLRPRFVIISRVPSLARFVTRLTSSSLETDNDSDSCSSEACLTAPSSLNYPPMTVAGPQITEEPTEETGRAKESSSGPDFLRDGLPTEIARRVLRQKLAKKRHLVLKEAIHPSYLDGIFPELLRLFQPQIVTYNGGVAQIPKWKISCYLEVMDGGIPTTEPNLELCQLFDPLLSACDDLFLYWYRQQHACNGRRQATASSSCRRLMTFVTRYTAQPGEQALLKVSGWMARGHGCTSSSSHVA